MQSFIDMENTVFRGLSYTVLFRNTQYSAVSQLLRFSCFRFSSVKVGNLIRQDWGFFSSHLIWV